MKPQPLASQCGTHRSSCGSRDAELAFGRTSCLILNLAGRANDGRPSPSAAQFLCDMTVNCVQLRDAGLPARCPGGGDAHQTNDDEKQTGNRKDPQ